VRRRIVRWRGSWRFGCTKLRRGNVSFFVGYVDRWIFKDRNSGLLAA
jgi:hypothetical protein